jgi:non-specific protein-tyrosine kinase
LILAGAIVLLMGYFDSSIKSGEVAAAVVDAPLLSTVPRLTRLRTGEGQLFVLSEPQSAASEAIRRLRTNIEFASAVQDVGTIAISSPGQGEGKSTVTANLAVTMAQAGLRVILIDADLRHPTQHSIFGVLNEGGLSTLLTHHELPWQTLAIDISSSPGLRLIPSGPLPPNPADLLGLGYLRTCLDEMGQAVDVVLIDTAPILDVADSLIVGANVDGMILVCRGNRTTRDQLRGAVAAVRQGDVSIIGVVVNQSVDAAQSYGYGSNNYGSRRIGSRDGSAFSPDQLAREAVTDPSAKNAHDVASRR